VFHQKIIEAAKLKFPYRPVRLANQSPIIVHPAISGQPVHTTNEDYFSEHFYHTYQSVTEGAKSGSPNTKLAIQWYKDHVTAREYQNSHYVVKVRERIPGRQALDGDWHNHDSGRNKKVFIISSVNPTLILNIPPIHLPYETLSHNNHIHTFPCIKLLIEQGLISSEDIFQPKSFEVIEMHESFLHISPIISFGNNILSEALRWFIFIRED